MLNKKIVISALVVGLNILHLFNPFDSLLNKDYNPILSLISLLGFILLVHIASGLKKDRFFVFLVSFSIICQILSFYQNSGVPDYLNFGIFHSNIPDLIILSTILTWWYKRVYKYQNLKAPANLPNEN
jgi:hypothetical protein